MSIRLEEPDFIRQTKMNSCWYACLKMLLKWHTGSSTINDNYVSGLASHFFPRSYTMLPKTFLDNNNLFFLDSNFTSIGQIEDNLRKYGPFMGGGLVGKFLGRRTFGHAILIYGVLPGGKILHHDPFLGPGSTIKGDKYLNLQDGERIHYQTTPRVEILGMGSR